MKIFYKILFTMTLAAGVLTGCQPEELYPMSGNPDSSGSSSVTKAAGDPLESLHRNEEGKWVATRRVPLTGKGRIVNNIANSLITAVTTDGDSNIGNLVDDDLSNSASFGGNLADVDAIANQIVSVRDLDHVYAGGQTVGFTYRIAGNGLLSVDVLKGFWIRTLLDGNEQDYMIGSEDGTDVLNLNLLSTLNDDGIQSLSFHTDKPFDEVQIGMAGINAELLGALDLYYVFVGDNDIKPVYTGSPDFPNASINKDKTTLEFHTSSEKLVDTSTENGVTIGTLLGLIEFVGGIFGHEPYITVDLGQTVEAGTEIGFLMQNVNVLELGLLNGIEFRTLDDSGDEIEIIKVEDDGLLGVSAIGGGKSLMGVTVKKPCSQIQIRFTGLDIKIGAKTIYYAYVRDAVENDISTYFSASDVTISGNSYHLPQPSVGQQVVWTLTDWPSGSTPQVIQSENKIIGMTVDGDYTLTTTYSSSVSGYSAALSSQETTVSVTFTIHRRTPSIGENCNQLIDQRYEAVAYIPEGGGALISFEDVEDPEFTVDDDPDNYAKYKNILISAGSNVGLLGIELGTDFEIEANSAQPTRVGFTMQTRSTFLDLDALKFFRIKLFNNGEQVDESVLDNNSTVSADLIGSRGNKVRMGFTTTKTFDRIELWSSGVLGLNLGEEYRIYNAFFEDGSENSECAGYDPSDACIEMLTPAAHGAEINYKETLIGGAASVGSSFNDLGNILAYISIGDRQRDIERLVSALSEVKRRFGKKGASIMSQEYIDTQVVEVDQDYTDYRNSREFFDDPDFGVVTDGATCNWKRRARELAKGIYPPFFSPRLLNDFNLSGYASFMRRTADTHFNAAVRVIERGCEMDARRCADIVSCGMYHTIDVSKQGLISTVFRTRARSYLFHSVVLIIGPRGMITQVKDGIITREFPWMNVEFVVLSPTDNTNMIQ